METKRDKIKVARESNGIIAGFLAAIGSARPGRREKEKGPRNVKIVSWAGRANTDSWFQFEIQQQKDRAALYYYARNQVK